MVTEPEIWKFVDYHYKEIIKQHMGIEGPFSLYHEYTLPNNQRVDRVVLATGNKVLALIECKGDVDTNSFVGGIGQAVQGAFQIKKNIEGNMDERALSFLLIPKGMAEKLDFTSFDLSNIKLLLADIETGTTTQFSPGDYKSEDIDQWTTINPYYFRDCSLEGVYFYLKLILKNSAILEKMRLTLSQMEKVVKEFKYKNDIEFFGDVRNNHIIPSVLGFYEPTKKVLTARGYEFARKNFKDFCKEIVLSELGEYSRAVIISILSLSANQKPDTEGFFLINTQSIAEFIKTIYEGKKVTYLFDPDGLNRNLLTIIRMLETIGSVKRNGASKIKINYLPLQGMPFLMEKYGNYDSKRLERWMNDFNLPL